MKLYVIFIIIIDRRRTYGSSKDSLSCYGSRKQLSSVSSSNVGGEKRKVLRSKTPYSSLPPPPVKKKNLTKVVKIKHIRVEVIVVFSRQTSIHLSHNMVIFIQPHNGCDFERLISISGGSSSSRRGSAKGSSTDKVNI